MAEVLVLDARIRDWVLLPIALVMFLVAILRNNISILLHSERKPELQALQERYNNAINSENLTPPLFFFYSHLFLLLLLLLL